MPNENDWILKSIDYLKLLYVVEKLYLLYQDENKFECNNFII